MIEKNPTKGLPAGGEGMKARRYIVCGWVQGVGYRWFARRHALALGINGYVKNLKDGSVEIWAEADESILMEVEPLLKAGPPGARVREVSVEDVAINGRFQGFGIEF